MKKKKTNQREKTPEEIAIDRLAMMKHKDLQLACIERGLEPNFIVEWSHSKLASWFIENFERTCNSLLIKEYDDWVDKQLIERGHKKGDAILHPSLRLGFTPLDDIPDKLLFKTIKIDKNDNSKTEKESTNEKPKGQPTIKRTTDLTTGVKTGTKKNLTFQLALKGTAMQDIITEVKKQFPGAEEKSIKIWAKKCLKVHRK